jgi:hypothetical protein
MPEFSADEEVSTEANAVKAVPARQSGRAGAKRKSYAEVDEDVEE